MNKTYYNDPEPDFNDPDVIDGYVEDPYYFNGGGYHHTSAGEYDHE